MPGKHEGPWSAELVRAQLVEAFRLVRSAPIWSPAKNVLITEDATLQERALHLITLTTKYLGRESRQRTMLLVWANAIARGRELSLREQCKEFGWSRSRFVRTCDVAADRLANFFNRDRIPLERFADLSRAAKVA